MPNRVLVEAVRHRLINLLGGQVISAMRDERSRYGTDDAVAFIDLQSLHHFLKENCKVLPTSVHVPHLIREFAMQHGIRLTQMIAATGIHDPAVNPTGHDAMARRLRWMKSQGVQVHALPLSYQTDRETGQVRATEKGVDVRLGSEIVRCAVKGLRTFVVISQDRDLCESLRVAAEIAEEKGESIRAFSPALVGTTWGHNGKCGMNGLPMTQRLPMHLDLVRKHSRPSWAGGANEKSVPEQDTPDSKVAEAAT